MNQGTIFWVLIGLLYLLPAIVAVARRHRSAGGIIVVDILLGWTILGWVAALAWSVSYAGEERARPIATDY